MAAPWASSSPDPAEDPSSSEPVDRSAPPPPAAQPLWKAPAGFPSGDELPPAMSLPCTARVLPPELADLDTALKSLLAADPKGWGDATVADAIVGMVALGAQLDAVASAIAGVWDTRRLWADDGSRSPKARLGRETSENPDRLRLIIWRATRLVSMPLVDAAWRKGEIGTDRVDVLCRANTPGRAGEYRESEPLLAWMATAIADFEEFNRKVRLWCDLADESGPEPDPDERGRKQREARNMHLGEGLDGVKFFTGRLDAVDGEIFARELQRIEQSLFEADWAFIRSEHGDAATAAHLPRTATQRRADALRIMAERSAACPDGARAPKPLISVVVDLASLMGPIRELFNCTVLTTGQIAGLLSEADIERAVFDGPSRVLDLGARTRLFTGATRRAIELRDRCCTFPGCSVDAEWCHADHITEWTDGGTTTQDNGRLLCPTHNRQRPGRRAGDPFDEPIEPTEPIESNETSEAHETGASDRPAGPAGSGASDATPEPPPDVEPTRTAVTEGSSDVRGATGWDGVERRMGTDRRGRAA